MFESRKGNRGSRIDFEKDLNILGENLLNERITFSNEIKKGPEDLTKVRYSPNRRVNLNTITEMVRSLAMIHNFNDEGIRQKISNEEK